MSLGKALLPATPSDSASVLRVVGLRPRMEEVAIVNRCTGRQYKQPLGMLPVDGKVRLRGRHRGRRLARNSGCCSRDRYRSAPAHLARLDSSDMTQKATFGAGCFWNAEAAFHQVAGVVDTTVGYEHASGTELVQVEYDPQQVTYERLLDVFWEIEDPTDPKRSELYRSVIYFYTPQQEAAALASKQQLDRSGIFDRPIVTDILPAQRFDRAPDSDQHYYTRPGALRCSIA